MTGEYFKIILLCALGALLIAAAVTDLRARIISNRLNLAVAALAPLWWLANGYALWPDMAVQLLVGAAIFTLFAALFALGMMGGGDVKLLTALALWFPWQAILSLVVLMALLGGVVTLVTVIHHKMTHRLGQPEIPYGVAISLAALWLLPWPTIF
ncbi:MAG: peptidase [Sphingobium sp.]|jgi:prepilin peptidase CpaA|uniref:Prepilin peptidase CpaA n=1 Tax=Sphingobium xenophagum TaxID=121428 RepID=A0A401IZW6_SPHXE|nr:prepilin peptidase [Sphingobium sp.]MBG6119657.1 prepilin peptidase CpaA [Sphingobium sp. JAI105]MBU0658880.1 prepilin peptidase [Alphaproteobacteria bacterium]PSO13260.1 peptidase [Sphingobium sp. AEW4]TWD11491.1 prepilin peptidase CpaA [Sphingobium sp. AEW010]TWD28618.1 prepilin peptidase CpaA [Sphingobium sp. AEW013]TWD30033.1 prepilin peptidase CpaA [Sphingobium sp. AEW001]GBH29908.1 prepilin peptidase CpaA [Sphingobium xenophagum]